MSTIQATGDEHPIKSRDDVTDHYVGALNNPNLDDNVSKIGIEVEFNLYNVDDLSPLSIPQSEDVVKACAQDDIPIHHEPSATTLEVLSDPFTPDIFQNLIDQTEHRFAKFIDVARAQGKFPSPFAHLPHLHHEDHHLIENDRYRAMWVPRREDMKGIFRSFLYPNAQTSISYEDYDHLLRIIRLSVVLEPLLFLTTDSASAFFDGKRVEYCPRFEMFNTRCRNGGIPDFYLQAKTGQELIDSHIDFTLNNPHVFVAFDFDGNLKQLPSGEWPSFLELEDKGYGPCDFLNYRQAQSESWRRSANISEIKADDGAVVAYRAEISSLFATGLQHQRASCAVISCLLAYCKNFYGNINALSKDFGIDMDDLYSAKAHLENNYEQATGHHGRYHEMPFGTKTLKDYAQGFSEIIQECLSGWKLDQYSGPLMHILTEGRPDWLVYREVFETLEQQTAYMKALPDLAAQNPALISNQSCADFTKDTITRFLSSSQ